MTRLSVFRLPLFFFSLTIFFSCSLGESSPPESISHKPAHAVSITLWGITLNDGYRIDNSKNIIFGFEREKASTDSEIGLTLPAGVNTFAVAKDGAECPVDGLTDATGSFIVLSTWNPAGLTILDFGESPGISLFVVTITPPASISLGSCDWKITPSTNADIQFARAIPDIEITYTPVVLSGSHSAVLDASATAPTYAGTILTVPSITSFAWTQTAGPAVALTGGDTATPSFTAPVVAADTDLTFQLTVTDDAGLTASETVSVKVVAP